MNPHLKQRMLSAAITADKLWQREVAKALTDGLAEIERMHALLAEVHRLQAPAVAKLQELLPLLHRLEHPTEEMREAMEGETPYFCAIGKSGYEVGYTNNADWRICVSEDQVILHVFSTQVEAQDNYEGLRFQWRYSEMLRVAADQPYTPTGESV